MEAEEVVLKVVIKKSRKEANSVCGFFMLIERVNPG